MPSVPSASCGQRVCWMRTDVTPAFLKGLVAALNKLVQSDHAARSHTAFIGVCAIYSQHN